MFWYSCYMHCCQQLWLTVCYWGEPEQAPHKQVCLFVCLCFSCLIGANAAENNIFKVSNLMWQSAFRETPEQSKTGYKKRQWPLFASSASSAFISHLDHWANTAGSKKKIIMTFFKLLDYTGQQPRQDFLSPKTEHKRLDSRRTADMAQPFERWK